MIAQGRVTINGKSAVLGQKVDPVNDRVMVDGSGVRPGVEVVYVLLHKPKGYLSTRRDDEDRPTVLDLIEGSDRYYMYPVGRLDLNSEGLMLLTNDGELAFALTHPRFSVPKTYQVHVNEPVDAAALTRLRKGIHLEDGPTRPAQVRRLSRPGHGHWYEIQIREGRNRQVRRMFEAIGARVRRLIRVAFGPLKLAGLPSGAHRSLTPEELRLLKEIYARHPVPA
jgi:pseudouridine synthase